MSLTIVADVGSASANSFVTEDEADTYLEARTNSSAWTGTTAKQQALISATRALSRLSWQGQRVTSAQALAWPRVYVVDPDAAFGTTYIDQSIIPQWLKDATCELAFEVLRAGTTDLFALPSTEGVIEKTVGPLTTRYADPTMQKTGWQRYPSVWALIAPYLTTNGMQVPTVRG